MTGVSATRTGPPPPPLAPRRTPPRVTLWRPDGAPALVEAHHVSDLVRINGWSRRDPATVSETPPVNSIDTNPDGELLPPEAFADAPAEPRAPLPVIDSLRSEVEALGGTPDPTWGIASLTAERDRLRATQSNKGDTDNAE